MQCCLFHQQTVVTTPSNFTSSAGSTFAGRRTTPNARFPSPRPLLHPLVPRSEGTGLSLTCLLASSSCWVASCSSKRRASAWPAVSSCSCLAASTSRCLRGERAQTTVTFQSRLAQEVTHSGCWDRQQESAVTHCSSPGCSTKGSDRFFYSRKEMKALCSVSGYHRGITRELSRSKSSVGQAFAILRMCSLREK